MKHIKIIVIILLITLSTNSFAETWNEPWQKEIIQHAEYFVFGKVISNDETGARIKIIKSFSDGISGEILVNGFSMLNLMSSSGHGLHLNFEKDQLLYLFLNKREDGNFAIPTPTSGYATIDEKNNVLATYRHSYHQASVPKEIYELTYSEIWKYQKFKKYDKEKINNFIDKQLAKNPAGFGEGEVATFFLQHVAMETAYLLDKPLELKKVEKHITSDNFHSRISALQSLTGNNNEISKEYLFNFIKNEKNGNFEKVIAIWALKKTDPSYDFRLKQLSKDLSDEDTGFGGNIMDPRIGTHFPTPKSAAGFYEK